MVRLQRQTFAVPEEMRIIGVISLPRRGGQPITSQLLHQLPAARTEAGINKRLFTMKRTETIYGGKIILPSGHKIRERDLLNAIGDPKKVPRFYVPVALQHGRLTQQGGANASTTMAQINCVALSTAQGWITKARDRGLLHSGDADARDEIRALRCEIRPWRVQAQAIPLRIAFTSASASAANSASAEQSRTSTSHVAE
ncbi:hypothetical protein [Agromyces sp. NPDC060279]|uniref:hypothetical protein n=1 Tax=Agromyces sp. NPDC060279 TaxID=3347092 RepID=UPI003658A66F